MILFVQQLSEPGHFIKVAKCKELPSWNDHYDKMVYLALKPPVWVSQISFLDAQI